MKEFLQKPENPESVLLMEKMNDALQALNRIPLKLHPWRAQNMYFQLRRDLFGRMDELAGNGQYVAKRWIRAFNELGGLLHIRVQEGMGRPFSI